MPEFRVSVLIAASGLALAAASASLGQSDPLSEPFPAVFDLDGLDGEIGFRIIGADYEHQSGWSMDAAGDVNGDGVDDLLLGVPGWTTGSGWHGPSGAATVLYGRASGNPFPAAFNLATIDGDNGFTVHAYNDDVAGYAVGAAGDMNGDGLADIAVGAPLMGWSTGEAYVVFGAAGSVPAQRVLYDVDGSNGFHLRSSSDFSRFGTSIVRVGDVNGDGHDDVGIGAPGQSTGYVVFGRGAEPFPPGVRVADLDGSDGFRIQPVLGSDRLGRSLAAAGDINGDGIDDMVIGAYMARRAGGTPSGAAFVVFGRDRFDPAISLADLDGTNGFRLDGVAAGDQTGFDVASAGDFNGDGVNDLIIGAWGARPRGIAGAGAAYVVFGRGDAYPAVIDLADLNGTNGVRLDGVAEDEQAGLSVAGLGDVNGDGLSDVVLGGFGGPVPPYGAGVAYVVFGSRDELPASLDMGDLDGRNGFSMVTAAVEDALGWSVSPAGDLNGDGIDDLAIASPWASPVSRYRVGVIHIVYGRTLAAPCPADLDADGTLTIFDFLAFQNLFDLMDPRADFDGDGDFTIFDFLAFQNAFDAGCP